MANLLQRAMKENESPAEQFERIGLPEYTAVTRADIQKLHESMKSQPVILEEYSWTRGAINAYRTLMKFVPEEFCGIICKNIIGEQCGAILSLVGENHIC